MSQTSEAEEVGVASSSQRQNRTNGTSVVEDQGVYSSTCGYCKATSRTSIAQGLWAHTLTVHDYQDMLDMGWRRSGMFAYKPHMRRTCCPPYTIRLQANAFDPSRDQSRVLRRMQRYLEGTYHGPPTVGELWRDGHGCTSERSDKASGKTKPSEVLDGAAKDLTVAIGSAIMSCVESGSLLLEANFPKVVVRKVSERVRGKLKDLNGQLEYTSSVAFSIAAAIKRKQGIKLPMELDIERDNQGNKSRSVPSKVEFTPVLVADILAARLLQFSGLCGFIPQACKGHLNFLEVVCPFGSDTSQPITSSEHPAPEGHSGAPKRPGFLESHGRKRGARGAPAILPEVKTLQLEIQMRRSAFDTEEFALYKRYQIVVHNDRPEDVKESSYCRFLVDTPLIWVPPENDGSTPPCGFGSFHQQYRIDGKLVAVGVVDVLPRCLSSKYLFWDPDLAFLSLGKYSALKEIKWVAEANNVCPSLKYYYLGFYIHSCTKMRYKAGYVPSDLLCPVTYTWVPYDIARPLLDGSEYSCLSDALKVEATDYQVPLESKSDTDTGEGSLIGIDDEGMSNDLMEARDSECERAEGREPHDLRELVPPQSYGQGMVDYSVDDTESLSHILLLLNNRCLSFKRLEESGVVPHRHMQSLMEQLRIYLQGVGPTLAARMAFALT